MKPRYTIENSSFFYILFPMQMDTWNSRHKQAVADCLPYLTASLKWRHPLLLNNAGEQFNIKHSDPRRNEMSRNKQTVCKKGVTELKMQVCEACVFSFFFVSKTKRKIRKLWLTVVMISLSISAMLYPFWPKEEVSALIHGSLFDTCVLT